MATPVTMPMWKVVISQGPILDKELQGSMAPERGRIKFFQQLVLA